MVNKVDVKNFNEFVSAEFNRTEVVHVETLRENEPPLCEVSFGKTLQCKNAYVHHEKVEIFAYSYCLSWSGLSKVEVDTHFPKIDPRKSYYLMLDHKGASIYGDPWAFISLTINGKEVLSQYNVSTGGYFLEKRFDVTPFLIEGDNHIELVLDGSSRTFYEIRSLSILDN